LASRLIPESSPHDEFAKSWGGRSAIQKLLNGGKLNARHLASMGKIQGTLCISGLINLSEMQIGDHALGSTRPPPGLSVLSAFAG
jgi:hypothetical protein